MVEPGADDGRVLAVVLCETRAWDLTAEGFISNVLDELRADLALCIGDREPPNPLYEKAKYVWRLEEPDNWAHAYDRAAGNSRWRVLLGVHEQLLGGVEDSEHPQIGSAAIGIRFRYFLKESIERAGITEAYDWMVVTRSDLMWPLPHPDVRYLSDRHIYVLDGEHYGGVSDRHILVPRRFVKPFLAIADPVFRDPEGLKRRINQRSAVQGWWVVNAERFLASRLRDLGLWRHLKYLPYVPFAVRAPGGSTRWRDGVFNENLGYFVKYPTELERSQVAQRFISDQGSWKKYLSPVRGVSARRRLRKAYRQLRDETGAAPRHYERAFPRIRGMHRRAYRWIRWTVLGQGPVPGGWSRSARRGARP